MASEKEKLALIIGSGFSSEFDLPTTNHMTKHFILEETSDMPLIDKVINKIISDYWDEVFGINNKPSLEDHFTLLDLSANSGHYLTVKYPPKKLRAIRRMSIHRIFQILDSFYKEKDYVIGYFKKIMEQYDVSIISLNWDIVLEKILLSINKTFDYGIEVSFLGPKPNNNNKVKLYKVHGSANWLYCDLCKSIHAGVSEKSALYYKAFLEETDFNLFNLTTDELNNVHKDIEATSDKRKCDICGNKLAGRLATFSYKKAFSINQFQTIWERAFRSLQEADKWIMIGYSLPKADYEFKYLLKSAQLARENLGNWSLDVVLKKDKIAKKSIIEFFGEENINLFDKGLKLAIENSHLDI